MTDPRTGRWVALKLGRRGRSLVEAGHTAVRAEFVNQERAELAAMSITRIDENVEQGATRVPAASSSPRAGWANALIVYEIDHLTQTPRELEDIIELAERQSVALVSVVIVIGRRVGAVGVRCRRTGPPTPGQNQSTGKCTQMSREARNST